MRLAYHESEMSMAKGRTSVRQEAWWDSECMRAQILGELCKHLRGQMAGCFGFLMLKFGFHGLDAHNVRTDFRI